MKNFYSLLILICLFFSASVQAQTYIDEDFTTFTDSINPPLASGWKNVDSIIPSNNEVWRFDNPYPRTFISPISGVAAILDSDFYGTGTTQDAYLTSPAFDASLATTVNLQFDHIHRDLNNIADVEVFDGNNWVVVASYGSVTNNNPNTVVIDISTQVAGVSNAQVRFRYSGSFDWYWIIDNVKVFQPQPDDLTTISVDSLVNGCNLDSIPVSATVVNIGTTTINSYTLNYTVNGTNLTTETPTTTLLPGDTLRYTFTKQADVSTLGTNVIDVYTFTRNDINNANDTASGNSIHLNSTSSFPYTEDFESGNGGWLSGGTSSSWQLGTPANTIINSAAGGTQAYVTNLTGAYNNNEVSTVTSPCFDFSGLVQPQIKMDIWVESENNYDGTVLQSSINGGLSWQTVGALNDPTNWYNGTAFSMANATANNACWTASSPFAPPAGWVLAERDLTGLGGQSSVRLRILHTTDGSVTEEGFGFDNILIQDAPSADAGIVEITRPATGCSLGNADSVEVRIINAGSTAISNFGLGFILNNGTPVNETFTGTINPGDTSNYIFTATVNLSALGTYNLQAYTALSSDGNATNDSLTSTLENIPVISTFPYTEGFETGNGGWVSGGTASSWQLGTPIGAIISSASAGTQAWVTNLSGTYNNNEVSFVESPCFDFSSLTQPQIKLDIWIESENNYDGTVLQSSIDGGASWQTVGALNDPTNWYNGTAFSMANATANNACWTNSSPFGTPGWVVAQHDLAGLGGQSSVRIRILHTTDGSVARDGFAFDEMLIQDAPSRDVEVLAISSPLSGCGLTSTDTVKVLITNVGSGAIDSIPLSYSVNSGPLYTDTSFTLLNPGDTIEFAFDTAYNFSFAGGYNIFAISSLVGDGTAFNDTASTNIDNTINTLQGLPYFEDFDGTGFTSGTGFDNIGSTLGNGWIANPSGSPDFFWGARNNATGSGNTGPDVDHTGNNGNFIFVEGSNGPNGSVAELYSPCIDLSTANSPNLEFWYHKYGANMPTLYVDVSDGSGWTTVDSIVGQTQTASLDPYLNKVVGLTQFAGGTIQLRFRTGSKTAFTNDMAIDDFRVFEPSTLDAGIASIDGPGSGCGLGAADSITVTLINAGSVQLDTVPVAYTVNFGGLTIDTSFTPIPAGGSISFTFSTTVNLSAAGNYFIDAYTTLNGDGNSSNDSAATTIISTAVASFPYVEDFESNNGGWTVSGTNASWAWGSPAGVYISNAGQGLNSWVTNLAGPYNNNEFSYLESPCIDMSGLTSDPTLVFQHIYETEDGYDEGFVEISTDGGQNWSKLITSPTAMNWYNDSLNQWWEDTSAAGAGNWQIASNDLLGAAGNAKVKIRFVMSSDGSVVFDGFGLDSVSIDLSIGITEQLSNNPFSVFPNPSEGQFILRNQEIGEDYQISVFDANGRIVYDRLVSFRSTDFMIDLSDQSKGLYFMRIIGEKDSFSKKLIIH